jgi:hypothetical protein
MRFVGRTILHVDMDAFYARPLDSATTSRCAARACSWGFARRVVLAASYEARPQGAAPPPMGEALRPVPARDRDAAAPGALRRVSAAVFAIFRRYTPLVEGISLDEAFLDVSAGAQLFGDGHATSPAHQGTTSAPGSTAWSRRPAWRRCGRRIAPAICTQADGGGWWCPTALAAFTTRCPSSGWGILAPRRRTAPAEAGGYLHRPAISRPRTATPAGALLARTEAGAATMQPLALARRRAERWISRSQSPSAPRNLRARSTPSAAALELQLSRPRRPRGEEGLHEAGVECTGAYDAQR